MHEWDLDTSVMRADVIDCGALANTKIHQRLNEMRARRALAEKTLVPRHPIARFTEEAYTAHLAVDAPADVAVAMESCRPRTYAAPQQNPSVTETSRSAPVAASLGPAKEPGESGSHRRFRGSTAAQLGSATSVGRVPIATGDSAYVRHLRSHLDMCERRRRGRDAAPVHRMSARGSTSGGGGVLATSAVPETSPARTSTEDGGDAEGVQPSSPFSVHKWVRAHQRAAWTQSSAPSDEFGTAVERASPITRKTPLLSQLRTSRFPREAEEASHWSGRDRRCDVTRSANGGHTVNTEVTAGQLHKIDTDTEDASRSPSTMITEVRLKQPGTAAANQEPPGNHSPESEQLRRQEQPRDDAGSDAALRQTAKGGDSILRELHAEPIQSYRVLKNATTRPASSLVERPKSLNRTLIGSGAIARENLTRCQHRFEHTRYATQADLLSFLKWRRDCRSAVCQDAVESTKRPDEPCRRESSGADAVATSVLGTLDRTGRCCQRRFSAPATVSRAASVSPSAPPLRGTTLHSAWTDAATVLAAEQMRAELCARLLSFTLSFPAAALSRESMERLRQEVVDSVRRTPAPPLYSKRDLKKLLLARQRSNTRGHEPSSPSPVAVATEAAEADIVDGMPSPAEAAFVRFAFDVLP